MFFKLNRNTWEWFRKNHLVLFKLFFSFTYFSGFSLSFPVCASPVLSMSHVYYSSYMNVLNTKDPNHFVNFLLAACKSSQPVGF